MSQIKTLNGVQYTLPQYSDTGWGANTGNVLTQYLAAIADVTLQLSGGAFTLTAEVDFGGSFGLKALYLKSETANPASAGNVRLAKTDSIKWRNNANAADIALAIDGSDNLQYNATKILLSGAVVNADINAAAAIAYSKLNLTGSIVNADINASAAIAVNKLAALTASVCPVTDASGFLSSSSVTATELSYVHGVTSAIQTQLNATIANPLTSNLAAGSHKITGLAAATLAGDALRYEQLFSASTITLLGSLAFNPTTAGIVGTTTNDAATSGNVGQYISATAQNVAATSNINITVVSISLTAGDWMVTGNIEFFTSATTFTQDYWLTYVGTSSSAGDLLEGDNGMYAETSTHTFGPATTIAARRYSLSTTTTLYLIGFNVHSSGSPTYEGRISAWRIR